MHAIFSDRAASVLKESDLTRGRPVDGKVVRFAGRKPAVRHGCHASERQKVPIEVRLIAVTRLRCQRCQGKRFVSPEQTQYPLKSQDPDVSLWSKTHCPAKVNNERPMTEAASLHCRLDRWERMHLIKDSCDGWVDASNARQPRRERIFQNDEPLLGASGFEQPLTHVIRRGSPEVPKRRVPFGQTLGGQAAKQQRCRSWPQDSADRA